jgi:hypothetical protein
MAQSSAPTIVQSPPTSVNLTDFKAAHAAILDMDLVGQAGGLSANIRYTPGLFTISTWVHSGPTSLPRPMTEEEIATLHTALDSQTKQTVPGVDLEALETFTDYLSEAAASAQPSNRFDQAVFGDIHKDQAGTLIGSMRVGVDVAGLVHDALGSVTVATYVVTMTPGPFLPLSKADQASLVRALEKAMGKSPPPNALWGDVLRDLKK